MSKQAQDDALPLVRDNGPLGELVRSYGAEVVEAIDEPRAWQRLNERLEARPARRWGFPFVMATGALALAAALFFWWRAPERIAPSAEHAALVTQGRADLPDGSAITAAADTRARWHETNEGVRVELEQGKVHCKVAKQTAPKQHFAVSSGAYAFVVFGTEFDVSSSAAGPRLDVMSGIVEVRRGAEILGRFTAGQSWSPALSPAPVAAPSVSVAVGELDEHVKEAPAKPAPSAEQVSCDALVKAQAFDRAARCYERRAQGSGLDAELALYELARLRLNALGDASGAVRACELYRARFPGGSFRSQIDKLWQRADVAAAKPPEVEKSGRGPEGRGAPGL